MPLVRVGVVLSAFGVHGDLKCAYTTDHPEWLAGRPRYLLADPRSHECEVLTTAEVSLRPEDFLIRFAGHDAPEPLRRFSGWELYYFAKRGELPRDTPDEVYLFELEGLEVRSDAGETIGRVSDVFDSGPYFILQLDAPGEPLIPFIDQHFPEVHLAEGYLVTSYPLSPAEREVVDPGNRAAPVGEGIGRDVIRAAKELQQRHNLPRRERKAERPPKGPRASNSNKAKP